MGDETKQALLVDGLEAVLGAMYVDSGLETVRRVVLQHVIAPEVEHLARNGSSLPLTDYKSALQEKLQATGRSQASYVLVKELGPEHSKTFTVEVTLQAVGNHGETEFVGRAEGSTKKNAEQGAAHQVLEHLASLPGHAGRQGARQRTSLAGIVMGKTSHPDWLISLQSLLTTVVIAVFVVTFIIQAFQIPSESMENTLLIGDYLLVDKLCYGGSRFLDRILPYRPVHRGDIVVFHYPVHPSEHFVKRVVGVPGIDCA